MSPDALIVIGIGIALAAINVALTAWLRAGLKYDYSRRDDRFRHRVEDRLRNIEIEQARMNGFLRCASRPFELGQGQARGPMQLPGGVAT